MPRVEEVKREEEGAATADESVEDDKGAYFPCNYALLHDTLRRTFFVS